MVSALVIGMHVAGAHLLVADQAAMYDNTMASIAVSVQQTNVVKSVVRTDAFVVTASRLKA
jgi:hypothetical protein